MDAPPPPRRATWPLAPRAALALVGLLAACAEEFERPLDPGAGVRYPVALVADPDGRSVYVVGANFDRAWHGGLVRVLDTATSRYLPAAKVEVPSFASAATLDLEGAGAAARRTLLVAARDDDSVTAIAVGAGADGARTLDCGRGSGVLGDCAGSHRLGGVAKGDLDLGSDPSALSLHRDASGAAVLTVVATGDGQVTPLRLRWREGGGVLGEPGERLSLGAGLSGVLHAPLTDRLYVSDARANRLHALAAEADAADALALRSFAGVQLPKAASSEYGRGLALSSDEGRLYVAYRNPNALLVVDVAPLPSGEPHDALVDVIGLGGRPAQVVVAPAGPGGRDLVFVSCFGTDDVWVVDPALRRVVDVLRLPHSPYALAVADVPGRGLTLYVALFSLHQVAVVPLQPAGGGRLQVQEVVQ